LTVPVFEKQVRLPAKNLSHPSTHARKLDETTDFWQARVNRDWRFFFHIQDDACVIVTMIPHPK
jgi:hypothetical protein